MASIIGAHYTKNGIKQFPARVIVSLNGVGLGGDETHQDTITIVRDTRVFPDGETTPDFNSFQPTQSVTWESYGQYWYADRTMEGGCLRDAWNKNPADYYQIQNEQGGNDAWALQRTVDIERAISWAAGADGKKCCVLNLAGGSPGDFELWKTICAPFIVEAWETWGHVYGRHAYADQFVDENGNILPGQPQRVIDELEYLKSIGYGGGVVLTECGLYGGYGVADYAYFEQQVQAWEAALRPYHDMLIGFCWWEAGKSEFDADYTDHLKTLVPYMQNSYLGRWEPATIDPPAPPPPQDTNLLVNPSFEDGWYHVDDRPEFQIPDGWRFDYVEGNSNPHSEWPFVAPEIRVLPSEQLPENERDLFILDGKQTLKAFKGNGAWDATFGQNVQLDGWYRLTANVYADLVKGYNDDGSKVWADDPNGNDGLVRLLVDDVIINDWYTLLPGIWNQCTWEFAADGNTNVTIEFMLPFPLANSGIFADDWQLVKIGEIKPPDNGEGETVKVTKNKKFWQNAIITHIGDVTNGTLTINERALIDGQQTQLRQHIIEIGDDSSNLLFKFVGNQTFEFEVECDENPNPPIVTLPKNTMGVDVSFWQGNFNWQQAILNGCKFGIIRCSDGVTANTDSHDENGIDRQFLNNAQALHQYGLPFSVYHYLRPGNIAAQAQKVVAAVSGLEASGIAPKTAVFDDGTMLPQIWIDVEDYALSAADVIDFYNALADSYTVGIYTGKPVWDAIHAGQVVWWSNVPLWIAAYGVNDGKLPNWTSPYMPIGWGKAQIWQYTSLGGYELGFPVQGLDLNSAGPYIDDDTEPEPDPPTPPTGETYSTAFMRGEPGIWRVIRRGDGSGENVWELPLDSNNDVRVKNETEGEWYEYRADGVYRLIDTSPAPDLAGNDRLYQLSINGVLGGKIAPNEAVVGKTYSYTNEVQFKRKSDCTNLPENSGLAVSTFTLLNVVDDYTFETGLTVDRLYVTEQTGEQQLYAETNGRIIGWCGGGATQDNNVWAGQLAEIYYDREIPAQEPPRFCS